MQLNKRPEATAKGPPDDDAEMTSTPDGDLADLAADGLLGPNPFVGLRVADVLAAMQEALWNAARQPQLLVGLQIELARELVAIWAGRSSLAPAPTDKRFNDEAWQDNPFYRVWLQGYLAWARGLDRLVTELNFNRRDSERMRFAVTLMTDALAPSNSILSNPVALRKLAQSGGASLAKGLQNMVQDLLTNHGMPAQVDKTAFQVGRNLAASAGAVVFRNEVLELIQYTPAGASVFARPLVIVPPQINKFYLFDLAPSRSVVEYLVRNNFQVFAVSWRNPTSAQRDWSMDAYVEALLEAIDAARSIAEVDSINVAGACSGAMTLSALLGHLAAKRDHRVHAATLIVVVLDRSDESQIALFATPDSVAAAKRASQIKGVLGGEEMGRMFAWMRPNDLIWNYWVNNYLLGNAPPAFDILYWNSDVTRLPARFHGQVLDIYVDNGFAKPGGVTVLGTAIDLTRVDCDKYVVAGITDHITPWQGGYRVARLFGGTTDFILCSSGHIQSIINPPGNHKAKYFINSRRPAEPAKWLTEAKAIRGSWWDDWRQWLEARSGASVSARPGLGNRLYPKLTEAPGTYVLAS